jgi:anaerobic ribonucleoside-triphosphate reductase activating protein
MNIAYIEEQSFIYGPGCRFVIWTQGCSLHCAGCWNDTLWDFRDNRIMSVDQVFTQAAEKGLIEGITLLGGEPLDQYDETLSLARMCQDRGLSVMVFTGYELAEIRKKGMAAIMDYTDILITGRYDKAKRTLNHQWIGSTNQKINFVSGRYRDYRKPDANYMEIDIDETGSITVLGFPGDSMRDKVLQDTGDIFEDANGCLKERIYG